ncbi:MAG: redoxin domain-containing protein [Acidobacteriaceae bacterium]|jgi:peroxiredoxin
MRRIQFGLLLAVFATSASVVSALPAGSIAPDFKGVDSNGATHSLSDYRGKFVVLEWANRGCPYEQKHYLSGNMESLQKQWTSKGVVWLSILSDGPGQQGYVTPAEENDYLKTMHASPTAALLDPTGAIGRLYQARTTPHIFVIDPTGKIVYQGAIDDQPTPDPSSLKGADNYLNDALNASMAGKSVTLAATKPYGCAVHYAN